MYYACLNIYVHTYVSTHVTEFMKTVHILTQRQNTTNQLLYQ